MSEIRPVGPGAGAHPGEGRNARHAGRPASGAGEPAPTPDGGSVEGGLRRPRYVEIAELRRLQAQLDRQHTAARVLPRGQLLQDLAGQVRFDPTLPHPTPIPGDRPMDLARLNGILRTLVAEGSGSSEGPRAEMHAVLEAWCQSRERLVNRLATRG